MPEISPSLSGWIGDADARRQLQQFGVEQGDLRLRYLSERADDYYLTLVNHLFAFLRDEEATRSGQWARLGNALNQFADSDNEDELLRFGIDRTEARLFAATSFYCGGYPASASLILRQASAPAAEGVQRAVFELLARPAEFVSRPARRLLQTLSRGDPREIARVRDSAAADEELALAVGPEHWISSRLWLKVVEHFARTNLRAVLPDGFSGFWSPLVDSMIERRPSVYEFFPSQIDAIRAGLVSSDESFSLQMPTGAGKTALCETLLFWQAKRNPSVSVLLVPYRSLAAELRRSIMPRLRRMGVSVSCAYGGTVPSQDELQALDETQVLIATPETLAGLLSADETFFDRIALLICDEGHLIDAAGRGIGLELLLARFKARRAGAPRFIFISAIVPNIEEINIWLGGSADTVVHSDYRPAQAEFAKLQFLGIGRTAAVELVMHPETQAPVRYAIPGFLTREDFRFMNETTGRPNTYGFRSYKTQAVAAARKALTMGGVVIFAANKRGDQGAIGVGEELLSQLEVSLPLASPVVDYGDTRLRARAVAYLAAEYGPDWLGTKLLNNGAVLHHGDIPQETREVFEALLREQHVRLAICTSTLAEGVNLPIRTLVLYSVLRRGPAGQMIPLNSRDIKNLVGRAGRAGTTTRGLVICANENQWELIEPVALQRPGEDVRGALFRFLTTLRNAVAARGEFRPTNEALETNPAFFPIVDGLDSALLDLIAEEMGEVQLLETAQQVINQTFAARAADAPRRNLLSQIVRSRVTRISELRNQQRLPWIKETGARVRTLRAVEAELLPLRPAWDNFRAATDDELVTALLTWAWPQREMRNSVMEAYRISADQVHGVQEQVFQIVRLWLNGESHERIGRAAGLEIDELLGVMTRVVGFTLLTILEQGISLLKKLLEEQGRELAAAVEQFPDALRFGLPLPKAVQLAAGGVRHRRAALALGRADPIRESVTDNARVILRLAKTELERDEAGWRRALGDLVFEHTHADLGR